MELQKKQAAKNRVKDEHTKNNTSHLPIFHMIKDVDKNKNIFKKNKNHVFSGTWWRYPLSYLDVSKNRRSPAYQFSCLRGKHGGSTVGWKGSQEKVDWDRWMNIQERYPKNYVFDIGLES